MRTSNCGSLTHLRRVQILAFMVSGMSFSSWALSSDSTRGTAITFDGVNQYANAGRTDLDLTTGFTIEAWVKVDAFTANWQAIVTKGDNAWRLHRNEGTDAASFGTSGLSNVDMAGSTSINDGEWHHLAAVYTGSEKLLYVDGVLDASMAVTGTLSTNTYPVFIGENAQMTARRFEGSMDEVRIWNIGRSASEIREFMHQSLDGSESGLVAYWQMNEGTGASAFDAADDNTATLVNSPVWISSTIPFGSSNVHVSSVSDSATTATVGPVMLTFIDGFAGTTSIVATEFFSEPSTLPESADQTLANMYYALSAFDSAGSFEATLTFYLPDGTLEEEDELEPAQLKLYKRPLTSSGAWTEIDSAESVDAESGSVVFGGSLISLGQFAIVRIAGPIAGAGTALLLDGTSGYVDFGSDPADLSGLSYMTVELWVNPSSFGTRRIFEKEDEWYLFEATNSISFALHGQVGGPINSGTLTAGQWVHIAATYNGSQVSLYVNGNLKGTVSHGDGIQNSAYPMTLGARRADGGSAAQFFAGSMDDIRVWNVARSAAEIRQYMHSALDGTESGLIAYWPMNDSLAMQVTDIAGSNPGAGVGGGAWQTSTAPMSASAVDTVSVTSSDTFAESGPVRIDLSDEFDGASSLLAATFSYPPNAYPGSFSEVLGDRFFVVSAFGTPGTFSGTLTFTLDGATFNPLDEGNPVGVKLYTRPTGSEDAWTFVSSATSVNATTGTIAFESSVSEFSQFVIVEDESALPVQLATIAAQMEGENVVLRWGTVTEVDNAGWEVERRIGRSQMSEVRGQTEAEGWVKIAFVEGAGTSTTPKEYLFSDTPPIHTPQSTLSYRLRQMDRSGSFSYSQEVEVSLDVLAPRVFHLAQNYPNPFNPSTTIEYTIESDGPVTLKVYDLIGREVATLVNEVQAAGVQHKVAFESGALATGTYIVRLTSGQKSQTQRILLLR